MCIDRVQSCIAEESKLMAAVSDFLHVFQMFVRDSTHYVRSRNSSPHVLSPRNSPHALHTLISTRCCHLQPFLFLQNIGDLSANTRAEATAGPCQHSEKRTSWYIINVKVHNLSPCTFLSAVLSKIPQLVYTPTDDLRMNPRADMFLFISTLLAYCLTIIHHAHALPQLAGPPAPEASMAAEILSIPRYSFPPFITPYSHGPKVPLQ